MKKLYRSTRDRKLTGLCGGLSEYLNVDATLLRILLIVVTVFSSGMIIVVYIIASLVIPKEPSPYGPFGPNSFPPGSGGFGPGPGFGPGGPPPGAGPRYGPPPGSGPRYGPGPTPPPGGFDPFRGPQQNQYQEPPRPNWNEPKFQEDQAQNKQFDSMMDDLEKKALKREIDELKAKLDELKKGDN